VSTQWHILLLLLGAVVGLGVVFHGWFKQTSIIAVVSWVGTQIASVIQNQGAVDAARRLASVAVELRLVEGAYWFLWGAVFSALGTFVVGSIGVYASAYREYEREKRPDALAQAGSRVALFLAHGVKPYLAYHSPGSTDARTLVRAKRVKFHELLLAHLRRTVISRRLSYQDFQDASEQLGGTMLTLLFEPDGMLKEYRLAVFKLATDGKQLAPIVTVNRGDWRAHSPLPLERFGSFLGAALDEGEPLVYPRDKSGRKFQKRGKTRWKSFLAMPLPCDTSLTRWGGITVDHAAGADVFTPDRIEAVRDYARFVEILYALVDKKEDSHEARAS
jgi:hypothetical protein